MGLSGSCYKFIDWIKKLQDDMKSAKADIGIIFSTAIPKDFDKKKGYLELHEPSML